MVGWCDDDDMEDVHDEYEEVDDNVDDSKVVTGWFEFVSVVALLVVGVVPRDKSNIDEHVPSRFEIELSRNNLCRFIEDNRS